MRTDTPKGYEPPLTAVLPFLAVTAVLFTAFGFLAGIGSLAVVGMAIWRQRSSELHLTGEGAHVSEPPYVDRLVRWRDVTGVRRGRAWSSGLVLVTRSDRVRCPAPTSWWGGRATPAQVAEVERWWLEHRGAGGDATI